MSYRVVMLGSPAEVLPVFDELLNLHREKKIFFCGVVSQPARPSGRKKILTDTPLAEKAKQSNIKCLQPEKASDPNFLEAFRSLKPDIALTAAYGQILSDEFLKIPARATINIHPSLLPQYRGATPVQTSLLNGDRRTGVSILFTVKKLDAGALILQKSYEILPLETAGALMLRSFEFAAKMLKECFELLKDPSYKGSPQSESQISLCKKISKAEGMIDWTKDAQNILHLWQAYTPWPGSFTYFGNQRILISRLKEAIPSNDNNPIPGKISWDSQRKTLKVYCGRGSLVIEALTPEGKKIQSGQDFWNRIPVPQRAEARFGVKS